MGCVSSTPKDVDQSDKDQTTSGGLSKEVPGLKQQLSRSLDKNTSQLADYMGQGDNKPSYNNNSQEDDGCKPNKPNKPNDKPFPEKLEGRMRFDFNLDIKDPTTGEQIPLQLGTCKEIRPVTPETDQDAKKIIDRFYAVKKKYGFQMYQVIPKMLIHGAQELPDFVDSPEDPKKQLFKKVPKFKSPWVKRTAAVAMQSRVPSKLIFKTVLDEQKIGKSDEKPETVMHKSAMSAMSATVDYEGYMEVVRSRRDGSTYVMYIRGSSVGVDDTLALFNASETEWSPYFEFIRDTSVSTPDTYLIRAYNESGTEYYYLNTYPWYELNGRRYRYGVHLDRDSNEIEFEGEINPDAIDYRLRYTLYWNGFDSEYKMLDSQATQLDVSRNTLFCVDHDRSGGEMFRCNGASDHPRAFVFRLVTEDTS